jgi:hypothetical protein
LNQTPKKDIGTKNTPSSLTFPSECLHRPRLSISIGCVFFSLTTKQTTKSSTPQSKKSTHNNKPHHILENLLDHSSNKSIGQEQTVLQIEQKLQNQINPTSLKIKVEQILHVGIDLKV